MSKIICLHCGATNGYYQEGNRAGSATIMYDANGNEVADEGEMNWYFADESVFCCADCNKDITKNIDIVY